MIDVGGEGPDIAVVGGEECDCQPSVMCATHFEYVSVKQGTEIPMIEEKTVIIKGTKIITLQHKERV